MFVRIFYTTKVRVGQGTGCKYRDNEKVTKSKKFFFMSRLECVSNISSSSV